METASCTKTHWDGREALALEGGGYSALVVPSLGANVIQLTCQWQGGVVDVLRTPRNAQTLLDDPYVYGVPVLFPANRVKGSGYRWDGVTYSFPQNHPDGMHIHGVLHNREWPVEEYGVTGEGTARVRLELDTAKDLELRRNFPLDIIFSLEITLDRGGLLHTFTVRNGSNRQFPVGLAYHTAFNVPFCRGGEDTRLMAPIGARCTDHPGDRLPDGGTCPLDEYEQRLASPQGADPMEKTLDYLYTAGTETREAVLESRQAGCQVVYRAGPENKYWILWNKTTRENFIAIEPQTWLSNAMNTPDPLKNGAITVSPQSSWSGTARIFVRPLKG